MLSSAWLLIYLIPVIGILSVVILFFVSFLVLGSLDVTAPMAFPVLAVGSVFLIFVAVVGGILSIYLIYLLVARRTEHFMRQRGILTSVAAVLKEKGKETKELDTILYDVEREERPRGAGLWVILSLVTAIAALYVYHFLNKDFYKHERREDEALTYLRTTLSLDVSSRVEAITNRSTALFIILSIITLGLFSIYWVYTVIKDANNHFKNHIGWEDRLVTAIEAL